METYCEICDDFTEYEIIEEKMGQKVRGVLIIYSGKKACCLKCGSEVYDEEVLEYNSHKLGEAYEMKLGIKLKQ